VNRTALRSGLRRTWLVWVFLAVVVVSAVRWTGSAARDDALERLDARLGDAGVGANAAMLDTEREHLEALRAFTFTEGVADALAVRDVDRLEALLGPLDANLGIPMVDVLDTRGRVLLALRGEGTVAPIYRARDGIGIVQRALSGSPDELGERFSTLVVSDEGPLVATVGPVRGGDDAVVGAILVMTPLEDVLTTSTNEHGTWLTVYSASGGVPLATTAPAKPRTLTGSLQSLLPDDRLPVASSYRVPDGRARELLGALVVRHEPVAWIGAAEVDDTGAVGTQVSTLTALALLAVGLLVTLVILRWTRGGDRDDGATPPSTEQDVRAELPPIPDPVPMPVPAGRQRW